MDKDYIHGTNNSWSKKEINKKKLCSDTIINNAVTELRRFLNNKKASVYFYWNRAKAQK